MASFFGPLLVSPIRRGRSRYALRYIDGNDVRPTRLRRGTSGPT